MSEQEKVEKGANKMQDLFKSVVDNANTNIMLADNDLKITYVNPALLEMLRGAEAAIQAELPSFRVDGLIGRCIDDFHKNPAHQRRLLGNLTSTFESSVSLAGLTFGLIINPIFDADQNRAGSCVEWSDLTLQLEADRLAKESLRVKVGLDNAKTNLMIIDNDLKIMYVNNTLSELFRRSEGAIKQDVPAFSADGLIGRCIDDFHKNPAHQRKMIAGLTSTFNTKLVLGGRTFDLFANPVITDDGDRLGTTMEWEDITEKLAEEARQAEAAELIEEQSKVLGLMADGDLREKVSGDYHEESHVIIKDAVNKAIDGVNDVLGKTTNAVESVAQTVEQVSGSSEKLAEASTEQASAMEEITASLEETDSQVKANAENANVANQLVSETAGTAQEGQSKMESMMSAMNEIATSAQDIAKIIKVIDEIAFQTNLLALNAAVEAARAGKHGKGFAVVAQEVRNLAGRSAKAARETADLIEDSGKKVEGGVSIATQTAESLNSIVQNVVKVKDLVGEIATASDEQSKGIAEINKALADVNQSVQDVSSQSTELSSAASSLGDLTEGLKDEVSRFKLSDVSEGVDLSSFGENLSMEQLQQLMLHMKAQQKQQAAPSKSNGNGANKGNGKGNGNGVDPKNIIPLDSDERGYGDF